MYQPLERLLGIAGTALLLLAAVPAAADAPPALRVGIVDVNRVLQNSPEYLKDSEQYLDERKKLFDPGKAKTPAEFKNELLRRRPAIQEAQDKWNKIKQNFIGDSTVKIQQAADSVMKDKKLDFVLMDAPWYPYSPLRQYGAVDITTDVLLAMQQQNKK